MFVRLLCADPFLRWTGLLEFANVNPSVFKHS